MSRINKTLFTLSGLTLAFTLVFVVLRSRRSESPSLQEARVDNSSPALPEKNQETVSKSVMSDISPTLEDTETSQEGSVSGSNKMSLAAQKKKWSEKASFDVPTMENFLKYMFKEIPIKMPIKDLKNILEEKYALDFQLVPDRFNSPSYKTFKADYKGIEVIIGGQTENLAHSMQLRVKGDQDIAQLLSAILGEEIILEKPFYQNPEAGNQFWRFGEYEIVVQEAEKISSEPEDKGFVYVLLERSEEG